MINVKQKRSNITTNLINLQYSDIVWIIQSLHMNYVSLFLVLLRPLASAIMCIASGTCLSCVYKNLLEKSTIYKHSGLYKVVVL